MNNVSYIKCHQYTLTNVSFRIKLEVGQTGVVMGMAAGTSVNMIWQRQVLS